MLIYIERLILVLWFVYCGYILFYFPHICWVHISAVLLPTTRIPIALRWMGHFTLRVSVDVVTESYFGPIFAYLWMEVPAFGSKSTFTCQEIFTCYSFFISIFISFFISPIGYFCFFFILFVLDELFEDPELPPRLPDFRLASEDSGLKSFKLLDLWTSPE